MQSPGDIDTLDSLATRIAALSVAANHQYQLRPSACNNRGGQGGELEGSTSTSTETTASRSSTSKAHREPASPSSRTANASTRSKSKYKTTAGLQCSQRGPPQLTASPVPFPLSPNPSTGPLRSRKAITNSAASSNPILKLTPLSASLAAFYPSTPGGLFVPSFLMHPPPPAVVVWAQQERAGKRWTQAMVKGYNTGVFQGVAERREKDGNWVCTGARKGERGKEKGWKREKEGKEKRDKKERRGKEKEKEEETERGKEKEKEKVETERKSGTDSFRDVVEQGVEDGWMLERRRVKYGRVAY